MCSSHSRQMTSLNSILSEHREHRREHRVNTEKPQSSKRLQWINMDTPVKKQLVFEIYSVLVSSTKNSLLKIQLI